MTKNPRIRKFKQGPWPRPLVMAMMFLGLTWLFFDASALKTLILGAEAVSALVVLSSIAQWAYTKVAFTDEACRPGEEAIDEIIVSSRIRALGAIYIGTAIVLMGVYFSSYVGGPLTGVIVK